MSNVISFDPFRELENMFKRYNDPLSRNYIAKENESMMSGSWAPLVDIKETKDAYIIKGELPGMDKDDVNVSIDKNTLTIKGEKKIEHESEEDNVHRSECRYGLFERSFSLPKEVDVKKIDASFKNGVLRLTVAKSEAVKPKQIQVKID